MLIPDRILTALSWTAGLCLMLTSSLDAQEGTVTGRITNEANGQPLGEVRVQASGTSLSAMSTPQGTYSIRLSAGSYQLRAVRIGFASASRSVTVRAGETATVDWTLKTVPYALDEVVVTATGEQLRRELGNSVGRIDARTIAETAPVTNISQVLSGRTAGVDVLQSTSTI